MADNDNEDNRPLGQRIRSFLEPALEDPRRSPKQLEMLSNIFNSYAAVLPQKLEEEFTNFSSFVDAASRAQDEGEGRPETRNPTIIHGITNINPRTGEPDYTPIRKFGLPIYTGFTDFSMSQILELPGYINLHVAAREADVALKILGLTVDETKASSYGVPAMVIIDGSKSYEEGLEENPGMYPDLPERKKAPPKFKRRSGGGQFG